MKKKLLSFTAILILLLMLVGTVKAKQLPAQGVTVTTNCVDGFCFTSIGIDYGAYRDSIIIESVDSSYVCINMHEGDRLCR
jgi:hypothetical protein